MNHKLEPLHLRLFAALNLNPGVETKKKMQRQKL